MKSSATCSYTHDTTSALFADEPQDSWTCPHPTHENTDRCIFHQPEAAWGSRDVNPETIGQSLIAAVNHENPARNRILGCKSPGIDLRYSTLNGPSNHTIDLRASRIEGPLDVSHSDIVNGLKLDGSTVRGDALFRDTTFRSESSFDGCVFRGTAGFHIATFHSWIRFENTTFRDQALFRTARFERGLYGVDAVFEDAADFMSADFVQVANLFQASFHQGAIFSSARFRGNVNFKGCTFLGPTAVGTNLVDDPSLASSDLPYDDGSIPGHALVLSSTHCSGNLSLDEATIGKNVYLVGGRLEGDLRIASINVPADANVTVVATDTGTVSGTVEAHPRVTYDFTNSTIGDLAIEDLDASRNAFDQMIFQSTTFDGFDFGNYKAHFRRNNWRLHAGPSTPPTVRENTYMRAKNGALKIGEKDAAREFHFREMQNRGRAFLQHVGDMTIVEGFRPTLWNLYLVLTLLTRWASNQIFRLTCGYGERPGRVVTCSLAVILVYAIVYQVLGIPLKYEGATSSLAFSFQSFNAIILGIPPVDRATIGVIVSTEAFLGPFFVALFVFTITQSLSR